MSENSFVDVFVSEQPFPALVYRTGMTTYQEALIDGQFIGRVWNTQGSVHRDESTIDPSSHPTPQAFWLEVDGQLLHSHWEWGGIEKTESDNSLHAVITLKHSVRPVEVKVHTILDGTPVITRWLEVTNTSDKPAALSRAYPWSGVLHTGSTRDMLYGEDEPEQRYSIGYMTDTRWGGEGNFEWHPLPSAGYRIDGRYRRLRHRHPMFILRNELTGEHFIGQFAWSGGYSFEFDYDDRPGVSQRDPRLFFRAGVDAPAPFRTIAPGETVAVPEMHLGLVTGDFDEAVQSMHDHLRKSVFPPQPRGHGGWVEVGIGPEYEFAEEMVRNCIDMAADIGAEIFFIDAGWYADSGGLWYETLGDWNLGGRLPNGIAPIREYVKSKGMLWGLWMEPERLGVKSKTYQEHPEWIHKNYRGQEIGGWIDLTIPEAAKWMEEQIIRVITEHELDFFRLDYNVGGAYGAGGHLRDGYLENTYWRYYEAFYGIMSRVHERFPDLIMENCAGGGGRTDIGTVRLFNHTWVTDYQAAPRSFSISNGMTIALPPEYVDRHLLGVGQNSHLAGDLDFQARLSLFGRPTIAGMFSPVGSKRNPLVIDRVKRTVELYKNFVRPFMPTSRLYHHTPAVTQRNPKGFGVLEMVSEDRSKAIAGVFKLGGMAQSDYLLRFRGLDPAKEYQVTIDSTQTTFEADGDDLMYEGLALHLEAPLASELLIVSEE